MPPPFPSEVIRRGHKGEFVRDWQEFLSAECEYGIAIDGDFGGETVYCTKLFQAWRGLPQTGEVDVVTWDAAADFNPPTQYKFIAAKNYSKAFRARVDLAVIHTMEFPSKPDTAERVAAWGAGPDAPKASWHYAVDIDSVVQSVKDHCIAWHAPGANDVGIGIEHAGYAKFTREQWLAEPNMNMLRLSARLVAEKCRKYSIPMRFLDTDAVKSRERGITGHKQITDAFSSGKGHWDPGLGWPWDIYIRMVNGERL